MHLILYRKIENREAGRERETIINLDEQIFFYYTK